LIGTTPGPDKATSPILMSGSALSPDISIGYE
jgi:hypothetical protein